MAFIPSPQQANVFNWGLTGKGNSFVEAVAGAGKTTTLMELTDQLLNKNSSSRIIIVAYSKKIAEELKGKLLKRGLNAFASTFHSFGFSAWKFFSKNRNLKVDNYKIANIMEEMQVDEGYRSFVSSLVSLAKNHVLSPVVSANWQGLVDHHDLTELLEDSGNDEDNEKNNYYTAEEGIKIAVAVLKKSNELRTQVIDFDDMIYLPVFFNLKVFTHDFVMVDEAQDTNPSRRRLAGMMVKPGSGRIIWVGDRHQAIFGFTGADADSVDLIVESFKCKQLPLTVTYRCPKTVVAEAQKYVNHITAHESAPEGKVETIDRAKFHEHFAALKKDDAILCRKTAPLVDLAYQLIRKGIACHVEGKDIGKGIKDLLLKWKKIKSKDAYLNKLDEWERIQVERLMKKKKETAAEAIKDKCETIRVLADGCETVQCMVDKVNSIFGDSDSHDPKERERCNNLTLSTVHKSKGREWGNVYILGFAEYMPSKMAKQDWEKEQEKNLIYVAITRAQEKLVYVG